MEHPRPGFPALGSPDLPASPSSWKTPSPAPQAAVPKTCQASRRPHVLSLIPLLDCPFVPCKATGCRLPVSSGLLWIPTDHRFLQQGCTRLQSPVIAHLSGCVRRLGRRSLCRLGRWLPQQMFLIPSAPCSLELHLPRTPAQLPARRLCPRLVNL